MMSILQVSDVTKAYNLTKLLLYNWSNNMPQFQNDDLIVWKFETCLQASHDNFNSEKKYYYLY